MLLLWRNIPRRPAELPCSFVCPAWAVSQFRLRQPRIACTLTGAGVAAELEQNLAALSAPLSEHVWAELEQFALTEGQQ